MAVTIRQKTDKRGRGQPWWVFIHRNGIVRSKKIGDRRAAEAVASAIRRKLAAGELNLDLPKRGPKIPEFGSYAEIYLATYARKILKYTTWRGYEAIVKAHLNPTWKYKRLDEIGRAEIKRLLLSKQEAGLAAATVENIKALISGIFTHACEDEIIATNPALRLGRFIQRQDVRRHIKPLTREESVQFLETVQARFPLHYPLFLCAFRTGMRLGELLGLAWADVDFQGNRLHVQRSYTHGRFSTPKSGKSRVVDMSDQLRAVLLEHRETLKARFGGQQPSIEIPGAGKNPQVVQFLFPNRKGGPLSGDNIRKRVFYPLLEHADVPRFRFHDIRHTFASLLLAQGESLFYTKSQMGHASITTTVDVYGHLVPGSNRNAVNRLDDPVEPAIRLVSGDAG